MKLTIIAAKAKNGVIGIKGGLPWDLPTDLKHFKKTTSGHPIIMGRKTYESIGRPLPNRLNIVITKDQKHIEGVYKVPGLPEAIDLAYGLRDEAFIIGGAGLYQMALPWSTNMIITQLDQEFEGDTYFPNFNPNNWRMEFRPEDTFVDNGIFCSIANYIRVREESMNSVVHGTGKFNEMDVFNAQMSMSVAMANARIATRHRLRQMANEYQPIRNKE